MTIHCPGDQLTDARRHLALVMWTLGVVAYTVAVFNRTSLGISATHAVERFGIGATALGWFAVVQLLVYAVLQVPAGMLVDRFGPRRVLTCALLLMGAGQAQMAFASCYSVGVAARMVVGCGDALTFVSVLRLIVVWFQPGRIALLVLLTSTLGMAGNLISATPLLALLTKTGWTPTFTIVAAGTVLMGVVLFATIRDDTNGKDGLVETQPSTRSPSMLGDLVASWRTPGVRLGFWMLFTASFPWVSFTMLWGVQFLTVGQGTSPEVASVLLIVLVLANMTASPIFGQLAGWRPALRIALHGWVIGLVFTLWLAVLCWPAEHAPIWLLGVLTAALGLCGPASMLGMDVARTASSVDRVATVSAVANIGGFGGSLLAILLIGAIVDVAGSVGANPTVAFSVAFSSQFALFALGEWRVQRWARLARQQDSGIPRKSSPA